MSKIACHLMANHHVHMAGAQTRAGTLYAAPQNAPDWTYNIDIAIVRAADGGRYE
jgi:hypothetical protein